MHLQPIPLPPGTRRSRFRTLLPSLALLAAGASCGELDTHTDAPSTLATLQGSLTVPEDDPNFQPPNNLHIAVVWQAAGQTTDYSVTQDLPLTPVFPLRYVLDLREPPPAGALYQGSGYRAATGFLVAYDDLNGNGMLDWDGDAGTFVDRVVAVNPYLGLLYIDGTIPAIPEGSIVGTIALGYNEVAPNCLPINGGRTGPDGGVCRLNTYLPMSHPWDLPFSDNPALSTLICQKQNAGAESGGMSGASVGVSGTSGGVSGTSGGATGASGTSGASGATDTSDAGESSDASEPSDAGESSDPNVPINPQWSVRTQGTPPGGYPAAGEMTGYWAAGTFECFNSGLSYAIYTCTYTTVGVQDLCQTTQSNCSFLDVNLDGASAPPGWPCP